jgi:hypothetical protein
MVPLLKTKAEVPFDHLVTVWSIRYLLLILG